MSKSLNRNAHKFRRRLALTTVILIITILLARETDALVQRGQQILMLVITLIGVSLFLLPWWARWSRTRRKSRRCRTSRPAHSEKLASRGRSHKR